MTGIDNNAKVPIQCPQCKREFTKTIRELKGSGVKCPHCGVAFETSQFKKDMDKADRALKDFAQSVKNIKINIKL
jgi:peptide subunit release factor 1 (eRF1)